MENTLKSYQDTCSAISHGDFNNDQLSCLLQAIQYRRGIIARANQRELRLGDKVTFTSRNRAYTGDVVEFKRKNVVVRVSIPTANYRGSNAAVFTKYRVPAHMLTKV